MMKTTTNYDLYKTALAAADSALSAPDPLAVESTKLEAFTAAGHERADYPKWSNYFADHLATLAALKTQKTVATLAAAQPAAAV